MQKRQKNRRLFFELITIFDQHELKVNYNSRFRMMKISNDIVGRYSCVINQHYFALQNTRTYSYLQIRLYPRSENISLQLQYS